MNVNAVFVNSISAEIVVLQNTRISLVFMTRCTSIFVTIESNACTYSMYGSVQYVILLKSSVFDIVTSRIWDYRNLHWLVLQQKIFVHQLTDQSPVRPVS